MSFALIAALGIVAMFLIFLAIGKWYPVSGAEVLDWKPTRSFEEEVQLELDDIEQMLEAQNERRRRSGRPEISEDDIRAEVDSARRELEDRAATYRDRGDSDPA
jgi:hypothetical protein